MKKSSTTQNKSLQEKLNDYAASSTALKKQVRTNRDSKLYLLPVTAIAALGAVGSVHAQCNFNIADDQNIPADGAGFAFDVDGDMVNDFSVIEPAGTAAVKLKILNSDLSILRVAAQPDSSASALNVPDSASVTANYGGGNFIDENDPDIFLAYGVAALNGQFSTPGNIIFRNSTTGNLGFISFAIVSGIPGNAGGVDIDIDVAGLSENTGSITTNDCGTLPVELFSFKASPEEQTIQLVWQTATETNNAGFELQRSENGKNFKTLTFIEGEGTTLEQQNYQFEDSQLRSGQLYYYRLKQIDFDGTFEYSDIVTAQLEDDKQASATFAPNPSATDFTNLSYSATSAGRLQVQVFDVTGKQLLNIQSDVMEGTNDINLDLNALAAGTYFVKLEQGGQVLYERLVKE